MRDAGPRATADGPSTRPGRAARQGDGGPRSATPRRDRGQAAIELALALPLVAIAALTVVQVVVIARHQLALEVAAREGARAAAMAADPNGAAGRAAHAATGLRPLTVTATTASGRVTVTVSRVDPTNVPLVGLALGDVVQQATVTMAREPP